MYLCVSVIAFVSELTHIVALNVGKKWKIHFSPSAPDGVVANKLLLLLLLLPVSLVSE